MSHKWFEVFVFESCLWDGVGVSPPNACSDTFAGPVLADGGLRLFRRPVVTLTHKDDQAEGTNVERPLPLAARTLAHEIGHFVAWCLHGRHVYQSHGLMSQTIDSQSTAIDQDLADDFLDSCMMNPGCDPEANVLSAVVASVTTAWR